MIFERVTLAVSLSVLPSSTRALVARSLPSAGRDAAMPLCVSGSASRPGRGVVYSAARMICPWAWLVHLAGAPVDAALDALIQPVVHLPCGDVRSRED